MNFVGSLRAWVVLPLALAGFLLAGCATTPKIDWASRVGVYTYEQAILEFGPPDKNAKLKDGTIVAEWLTQRGGSYARSSPYYGLYPWYYDGFYPSHYDVYTYPDNFLRLVFDPEGRLKEFRKLYR
jgi:hypothetical protein